MPSTIEELNPDHAVTKLMKENAHKIILIMMRHYNIKEFEVTTEMINALGSDAAVGYDTRFGKFIVRALSRAEAEVLSQGILKTAEKRGFLWLMSKILMISKRYASV
jgi:hypothetical protein